jgi:hypothetical protein
MSNGFLKWNSTDRAAPSFPKQNEVPMFRMLFLIFLISMLLAGAVSAGTPLPALFLIGSLLVLVVLITLARSQPEE